MSGQPVKSRRVALYARVSTQDQTTENQLPQLRAFAEARGWAITEFADNRVSGAKEQRPALDAMLKAVTARKVDVVACVKLDRLARSVRHLVTMAHEFEALGVDLVVLDQAIDTTMPAGRLLFHVLAAISEFERDLIRDRVVAGMARARAQGKPIGRQRIPAKKARRIQALLDEGYGKLRVAKMVKVGTGTVQRIARESR
jgi:DNA invertase Pin-like site-specific DNA recombinase